MISVGEPEPAARIQGFTEREPEPVENYREPEPLYQFKASKGNLLKRLPRARSRRWTIFRGSL